MDSNILVRERVSVSTDEVYKNYKDKISELIAYIEVYEYDLPLEVTAKVAELFQTLKNCRVGEPVFLTKNGRGRYVLIDMYKLSS